MWRMLQKTKKRKSILSKDRNRINLRLGVFQCSHQREQKTQRGPAMSEQLTLNPVSYIVFCFFHAADSCEIFLQHTWVLHRQRGIKTMK